MTMQLVGLDDNLSGNDTVVPVANAQNNTVKSNCGESVNAALLPQDISILNKPQIWGAMMGLTDAKDEFVKKYKCESWLPSANTPESVIYSTVLATRGLFTDKYGNRVFVAIRNNRKEDGWTPHLKNMMLSATGDENAWRDRQSLKRDPRITYVHNNTNKIKDLDNDSIVAAYTKYIEATFEWIGDSCDSGWDDRFMKIFGSGKFSEIYYGFVGQKFPLPIIFTIQRMNKRVKQACGKESVDANIVTVVTTALTVACAIIPGAQALLPYIGPAVGALSSLAKGQGLNSNGLINIASTALAGSGVPIPNTVQTGLDVYNAYSAKDTAKMTKLVGAQVGIDTNQVSNMLKNNQITQVIKATGTTKTYTELSNIASGFQAVNNVKSVASKIDSGELSKAIEAGNFYKTPELQNAFIALASGALTTSIPSTSNGKSWIPALISKYNKELTPAEHKALIGLHYDLPIDNNAFDNIAIEMLIQRAKTANTLTIELPINMAAGKKECFAKTLTQKGYTVITNYTNPNKTVKTTTTTGTTKTNTTNSAKKVTTKKRNYFNKGV